MCPHSWITINDIRVCTRCGMTVTDDGKVLFDRKFVNQKEKRRKGGRRYAKKRNPVIS